MDARTAAACLPLIHGTVSINAAGVPEDNMTARPRGKADSSEASRTGALENSGLQLR